MIVCKLMDLLSNLLILSSARHLTPSNWRPSQPRPSAHNHSRQWLHVLAKSVRSQVCCRKPSRVCATTARGAPGASSKRSATPAEPALECARTSTSGDAELVTLAAANAASRCTTCTTRSLWDFIMAASINASIHFFICVYTEQVLVAQFLGMHSIASVNLIQHVV